MPNTIAEVCQKICFHCHARQQTSSESQETLILADQPKSGTEQGKVQKSARYATRTKGGLLVTVKGRDHREKGERKQINHEKRRNEEQSSLLEQKNMSEPDTFQDGRKGIELMRSLTDISSQVLPILPIQTAGIGGSKFIEVMEPSEDFPPFPFTGPAISPR